MVSAKWGFVSRPWQMGSGGWGLAGRSWQVGSGRWGSQWALLSATEVLVMVCIVEPFLRFEQLSSVVGDRDTRKPPVSRANLLLRTPLDQEQLVALHEGFV